MAAETNGRDAAPEELVERVQELTSRLEQLPDPAARDTAEALVSAVISLYGEGLERIFAALDEAGDAGAAIRERVSRDGVVASLMLIHGLYPVDLRARVLEALESVRPYMESHGGDVELVGLEDGIARIRLEGSCDGCPASSSTLELAIKQALQDAAPDLDGLVVEGAVESSQTAFGDGATELPVVTVAPGSPDAEPSWFDVDGLDDVAEGELRGVQVAGVEMIVARIDGSLLAYRDACAGCGSRIADGALSGDILACGSCERRYNLPRAGRSLDDDRLQLEPVPLLNLAGGTARVALAA